MKKQELKTLTKQWLDRNDPLLKYKKSPSYKLKQKLRLDRIKASKQKKLQKRQFSKMGL